jgi:hypothetical protein
MKKENFLKKLLLNKKTITNLNVDEMRNSRAGGDKTDIGISCDTGLTCCNTAIPNCKPEKIGPNNDKKTINKHCVI